MSKDTNRKRKDRVRRVSQSSGTDSGDEVLNLSAEVEASLLLQSPPRSPNLRVQVQDNATCALEVISDTDMDIDEGNDEPEVIAEVLGTRRRKVTFVDLIEGEEDPSRRSRSRERRPRTSKRPSCEKSPGRSNSSRTPRRPSPRPSTSTRPPRQPSPPRASTSNCQPREKANPRPTRPRSPVRAPVNPQLQMVREGRISRPRDRPLAIRFLPNWEPARDQNPVRHNFRHAPPREQYREGECEQVRQVSPRNLVLVPSEPYYVQKRSRGFIPDLRSIRLSPSRQFNKNPNRDSLDTADYSSFFPPEGDAYYRTNPLPKKYIFTWNGIPVCFSCRRLGYLHHLCPYCTFRRWEH
jgi:hypothetical protein